MYRIIISPEWYPSKENLLSAIFTKKHVEVIAKRDKVAVAFAIVSKSEKKNYNLVIEKGAYISVICYFKASNFPFLNKYIDYLNYFIAHCKAINKAKSLLGRIDFFHIHVLPKSAIIPFFYYVLKKVPYFISEHSTIYIRKKSYSVLEGWIRKILIKNSSGVSTVSYSLKSAMLDKGLVHLNFKVIPNVVDSQTFCPMTKANHSSVKFLHVSRLDEQAKNTIGILRVFDLLAQKYQEIELHIVGGLVKQTSDAEIFSKQLASNNSIFFHGVKLGSAIIPFYNQANYFVMFSNYETQAVVVLEALFSGIPVIATQLPALNEYLHNGNSLQVEVNNELALYNSMEACILKTHSFWKPEQIAQDIISKFDINKIEEGFKDFYSKGLNV